MVKSLAAFAEIHNREVCFALEVWKDCFETKQVQKTIGLYTWERTLNTLTSRNFSNSMRQEGSMASSRHFKSSMVFFRVFVATFSFGPNSATCAG